MIDKASVEVLLVEDLSEDAELTQRALRKHNLINEIKWVADGEEALEYLFGTGRYEGRDTNIKPKIILLDLKLPKVNGLEVLKAVRADRRTQAVPVVVMTSSKEGKDVKTAYELGANSYVVKPVTFANFAEVVRNVGYYWLVVNEFG